jgi:hypothetical protein
MFTNFHSKFAFTLDASTWSSLHVVEEEAKQEKGSRVRTPQGIQVVLEKIWKSRETPTWSCLHVVEEEAKQEKEAEYYLPQGIQVVLGKISKSRETPTWSCLHVVEEGAKLEKEAEYVPTRDPGSIRRNLEK